MPFTFITGTVYNRWGSHLNSESCHFATFNSNLSHDVNSFPAEFRSHLASFPFFFFISFFLSLALNPTVLVLVDEAKGKKVTGQTNFLRPAWPRLFSHLTVTARRSLIPPRRLIACNPAYLSKLMIFFSLPAIDGETPLLGREVNVHHAKTGATFQI